MGNIGVQTAERGIEEGVERRRQYNFNIL